LTSFLADLFSRQSNIAKKEKAMSAPRLDTLVSQLVIDRPSRSRVFQRLGIDFCCGGKVPLQQAARDRGLDPQAVLEMLETSEQAGEESFDASRLSASQLCDHIEQTHHAFLKSELPRLHVMLQKVVRAHGQRYPYMREVLDVFEPFMAELSRHTAKEEMVLFPLIRQLEEGKPLGRCCGGTVANPISMMEREHSDAGEALARLRQLTGDYAPPADACTTFRAALDGLAELERDMHLHVHKENNILFPRALELEEMAAASGSQCSIR
jgi:regulator of cell morphogenesis and NO signaling